MIEVYKYEELPESLIEACSSHLFYAPNWLSVLEKQYNCRFLATYNTESGAVLLFAKIKCLAGKKLMSLPFSDYTRPDLDSPEELTTHVEALREAYPDLPITVKVNFQQPFKPSPGLLSEPAERGFLHQVITDRQCQLEKNMFASFRRGVRKAKAYGLEFGTSCSREGLEQFYELFYQLRIRKHGLIPQSFSFFEKVFEEFISQGKGFIAEVRKEGRLLAAAIILQHQNGLYYKWGSSSLEDLRVRPNNLLFYELLHLAQRDGYDFVDLGLSNLKTNRGLIRFKRSMGGEESDIYHYEFLPEDYPFATMAEFKSIVNSMAGIVVSSKFDRKTTEMFSQTLYPLFA